MFGPELTPEVFDKKLPPVAPISRGRTPPRRGSTGFSILKGAGKTKTTAGVLAEEASPENLTGEEEEAGAPGTPVKGSDNEGIPVANLNENFRGSREANNSNESEDSHVDQPHLPKEDLNKSVVEEPEPGKARLSQGSSILSSEDNIVIYTDTESETSNNESGLNTTIDDFLSTTGRKSEIIQLNTSVCEPTIPEEPEPSKDTSILNTSSKSEILDLNKSAVEESGKERLISEGSSAASGDSDNIIIYNTESEASDKTDLEESVATEPGLDSTIDEFLKNDKTPAGTPAAPRRSQRKSVRFGPMLSPEEYDQDLPANTPIRKGGLPGRYSVPNPQLSAGRTPMRKTVATCATPVGQLNLDESIGSFGSLDSADQDPETRAKTQRRKTMTPKELKANLCWAGMAGESQKKQHVDSPIVTETPKIAKASIPFVLVRWILYLCFV